MNLKHKLQIQFEEETKTPSINSQKEFDIDYIYWLQNTASKLEADLSIARTQKYNIQKEHDILLDELRKAGLRKDPFVIDYSRTA